MIGSSARGQLNLNVGNFEFFVVFLAERTKIQRKKPILQRLFLTVSKMILQAMRIKGVLDRRKFRELFSGNLQAKS